MIVGAKMNVFEKHILFLISRNLIFGTKLTESTKGLFNTNSVFPESYKDSMARC